MFIVGVTVLKLRKLESFIIVLSAVGVAGVECALKCVSTGVAVGVVVEDAVGRDVKDDERGEAGNPAVAEPPMGGGALRPRKRCLSDVWRETAGVDACGVGVISPISGAGGRGPDGGGRGAATEVSEEYVADGSMMVSRT